MAAWLLLLAPGVTAQEVDIPVIVSDGAGGERELRFGLDPAATDGIDSHLGEAELPPFPPVGVFEARFTSTHASVSADLGLGSYRDYREGHGTFLGEVVHQLRYQVGDGTTITVIWDLPVGVSGRLQDIITGEHIDHTMEGEGSFVVENPDGVSTLLMTVTYAAVEAERSEQPPSGWRMLSAPVDGLTVQDLAEQTLVQGIPGEYPDADTNLFITYNGDNDDNTGGNVLGFVPPAGLGTALVPGRGFIWYLWEEPFDPEQPDGQSVSAGLPLVVAATGPAHQADIELTADDRAPMADEWFLIGNPFAEVLGVAGIEVSSGLLQEALWRWDPGASSERGGAVGSYVLLDDHADVWDGFFAEVTGHDLPLTFSFDARCRGGCPEPRAAVERNVVALVLSGMVGGVDAYDEAAYVSFVEGASDGWDRYDSSKLYPMGSMWAILSPMGDRFGEHAAKAIESRPLPEGPVAVPVSISALAEGEFAIALGERTDVPAEWTIELEDTTTGETVDLRETSYAFTLTDAVWMDERFIVHIEPGPISTEPVTSEYAFALAAVYPNPFAGSATVAFTLGDAADVQLAVYDVLGRRVAVLAEGEHGAGRHTVAVDGGALASGVYVVRLAAGEHVAAQRITVVR